MKLSVALGLVPGLVPGIRVDLFALRHTLTRCSILPPLQTNPGVDRAAQIFDLTGVAGVAVDDAGEPDA